MKRHLFIALGALACAAGSVLLFEPKQLGEFQADWSRPVIPVYGRYQGGYVGITRLKQCGHTVAAIGEAPQAVLKRLGPPTELRGDGIKGPIDDWRIRGTELEVVCNSGRVQAIFWTDASGQQVRATDDSSSRP